MIFMHIVNKKRGISIDDGELHEEDHVEFSRRRFIKSFGLAGGMGFMLGSLPVRAATLSKWSMPPILENSDRILVMIRLKGGNDGLNTIIPLMQLSSYHANRPQLGYKDNTMIQLNDQLAMSPHLADLKGLWDDGMMKVVNGVGYEDQNLSHFRSSDIWSSGSDEDTYLQSGWVGRYVETIYPNYVTDPPEDPPAIQIGGGSSLLFTGEDVAKVGFETYSAEQIEEFAITGAVHSLNDLPSCDYGEQLHYMRSLTNSTYRFVDRIKMSYANGPVSSANYTDTNFGESLKIVARMIKGGLKTKIYVVEIDGFDTHANQLGTHERILKALGRNVSAFFADFKQTPYEEKLLAVTFSEFGRRVRENDGPGTDHGAASVVLAFGRALNGNGSLGQYPLLTDLDVYGNLKYNIDFRHIYATLFTEWLCLDDPDSNDILMHDFGAPLAFGFDCLPTSSVTKVNKPAFEHMATYGNGDVFVQYRLPSDNLVMTELVSMTGHSVILERPTQKPAGSYQVPVKSKLRNLQPGAYAYRIRLRGMEYSGKLLVP